MSTRNKRTVVKIGKKPQAGTKKQSGKGLYDDTMNSLFGDKTNTLKSGEKHGLTYVQTSNTTGKYVVSNFTGPGTSLFERLKKNQKGLSYSDDVSMVHDLRYSLAKSDKDIRTADLKMIESLNRAKKDKLDFDFNINQGLYGIKTKNFLEDYIGVKPSSFTIYGEENLGEDEKSLYKKVLAQQELLGFGFGRCKF